MIFALQLIHRILPYFEKSQRQGYTYLEAKKGFYQTGNYSSLSY